MSATDFLFRIAKAMPEWKRLLTVADVHEKRLYKHFARAFHVGGSSLPKEFTDHQHAEESLNKALLLTDRAMVKGLPDLLYNATVAGGNVAALNLNHPFRASELRTLKEKTSFKSSAASQWARKHAASLISDISKTTRNKVRGIVADVLDGDLGWPQARKALTDIFDDKERARTIARTETMRAANEGQKQMWYQAEKDGSLGKGGKMTWIVTPDDRLCDICEEMEGEEADIHDGFDIDGPPAHPNCRCTIGLV